MKYAYLLGACLSANTPYLFMLACGFFFGKVKLITKEGLNSFAKITIEIFLPVYLFIHVARSTFTLNFELYGSFIISFLFYLIVAGLLSFLWSLLTKMDLRYRFTFICITSFVDIRRLHYLYINSFCSLLVLKNKKEREYCSNGNINTEVHTFFQGILIWYFAFNLIRVDKTYTRYSDELWNKINREDLKTESNMADPKEDKEMDNYFNQEVELVDQNSLTGEEKKKIKEIYNQYIVADDQHKTMQNEKDGIFGSTPPSQNKINNHQVIQVAGRQSFYQKIRQFRKARFCKNDAIWKEVIYILLRPPIIGLFTGFVVGFIRPIRLWLFDTTTPMFVCNLFIYF